MQIRNRDVVDLCEDLDLQKPSITLKEGWDHTPVMFVSFGPPAYRQIVEINPTWELKAIKAKLAAAKAGPLDEAPTSDQPNPEPKKRKKPLQPTK
jgi:hypothetical protein